MKAYRKTKIKRAIATMLVLVTIATSIQIPQNQEIYASPIENEGGNDNSDGSGGFSGDPQLCYRSYWNQSQQGYRFYVVDKNGNLVTNVLDICYSQPKRLVTENHMYNSTFNQSLTTSNKHKVITWEEAVQYVPELANTIPAPALVRNYGDANDVYDEMGAEFRQWVINGIGGNTIGNTITLVSNTGANNNSNKNTGSIGSGSSSGSGSTSGSSFYEGKSKAQVIRELLNGTSLESNNRIAEWIVKGGIKEALGSASDMAIVMAMNVGVSHKTREIVRDMFNASKGANGNVSEARLRWIYNTLVHSGLSQAEALKAIMTTCRNSVADAGADKTEYLASSGSLRQILPTETTDDTYLFKLFEYKEDRNNIPLLYFTGKGADNSLTVLEEMAKNGYKLVVEPIFWLKPAFGSVYIWRERSIPRYGLNARTGRYEIIGWYTERYLANNPNYREESYYVYGTLRDLVKYHAIYQGGRYGNHTKVMRQYGWASMVTTANVEFNNFTLQAVPSSWNSGNMSLWTQYNTASYVGYAMHVYSSDYVVYTKTRSDSNGLAVGAEHKAPVPDVSVQNEYNDNVTIVKVYRQDLDGNGEWEKSSTYTQRKEPGDIYILNEKTWTLKEWYVSGEASGVDNVNTSWDEMKSQVYGNKTQSGGAPSSDSWTSDAVLPGDSNMRGTKIRVNGGANATTLYLLYERVGEPAVDNSVDVVITESEISSAEVYNFNSSSEVEQANKRGEQYNNIFLNKAGYFSLMNNTFKYTIFRGDDKLTMAKYTGIDIDSSTEEEVSSYIGYYGIGGTTSMGRASSDYNANYSIALNDSDAILNQVKAKVEVYSGKARNTDSSIPSVNYTNTARVASGATVSFYPYIWMTTEELNGGKKIHNVLGDYMRTILPNDYASVDITKTGTLVVDSNMWATDKSIQQLKNKSGQEIGINTALKGGASYELSNSSTGEITVMSYQTVIDDNYNYNINKLEQNGYDLSTLSAFEEHINLVNSVEDEVTDLYKLNQYVNKEAVTNPAGESGSVVAESGGNITGLSNGSSTASTAEKYYLSGTGNIATSSFLEVSEKDTTSNFYRFFSLPNGNIYMVEGNSYEDCENKMTAIIRSAKANNGVYTNNIVVSKGTTNIVNAVASDINSKTFVVDKMLLALEIGTGNDSTAPWASDGKWYNEGTLGFTVVRQVTKIEIGILSVDSKPLVLDPKLIPQVAGKSDQNTKLFSSAFKVDYIGDDTLGIFKGTEMKKTEAGFEQLFNVSNTFYIPNSTVTDNK